MKKETALCLILEESICSTTNLPENTKAPSDIMSMSLSICSAEVAVLYFRDSEHLLQGLAWPQHQAEPSTNHLPGEGLESWAMGDTRLRCDLEIAIALPATAGEGRAVSGAQPSQGPSVLQAVRAEPGIWGVGPSSCASL